MAYGMALRSRMRDPTTAPTKSVLHLQSLRCQRQAHYRPFLMWTQTHQPCLLRFPTDMWRLFLSLAT